jgi:hypothetical protein
MLTNAWLFAAERRQMTAEVDCCTLTDGLVALLNGSIKSATSAIIVVQQSTLSCHLDLDPFDPRPPQDVPQIADQLRIVNLAKDCRVLLQLRQ